MTPAWLQSGIHEVKYKNILFPDKYSEAAPPLPESDNKMKSLSNKRQGAGSQLELWKHFSFFIIKLLATINWVSNQHVEVEMNIKEKMTYFV